MNVKELKKDINYICSKLIKDGKTLVLHGDNLSIVDGKYVSETPQLCALETLVLFRQPEIPKAIEDNYKLGFNLPLLEIVNAMTSISKNDLYEFLDGFENVDSKATDFYKVGAAVRSKFIEYKTDKLQIKIPLLSGYEH